MERSGLSATSVFQNLGVSSATREAQHDPGAELEAHFKTRST
jgi:hypothetical protein